MLRLAYLAADHFDTVKEKTTSQKFNRNVLVVVCLFGFLRVVIEMFRNKTSWNTFDFYLDISYGGVFLVTLLALHKKASYKVIYNSFFVPLVLLLCLTLYDRKGIASGTENNIHIGLMIITLTMTSRHARKFSAYLVLGTLAALVAVEWKHNFFHEYSKYSTSHFNFIFMAIGSIVVIFYAKLTFEKDQAELSKTEKNLVEQGSQLELSQAKLAMQNRELESLNLELEGKVNERASLLKSKQEAMQQYLDVTMEELQIDYREIEKMVGEVFQKDDDDISKMMLESSNDLDYEIKSLVNKLKENR